MTKSSAVREEEGGGGREERREHGKQFPMIGGRGVVEESLCGKR